MYLHLVFLHALPSVFVHVCVCVRSCVYPYLNIQTQIHMMSLVFSGLSTWYWLTNLGPLCQGGLLFKELPLSMAALLHPASFCYLEIITSQLYADMLQTTRNHSQLKSLFLCFAIIVYCELYHGLRTALPSKRNQI